jgi:6-phosphofructokinase 1
VEYSHARISEIANEAKSVPREWINEAGNDITSELIDYLKPLIEGEVTISYENGLPKYLDISHLN